MYIETVPNRGSRPAYLLRDARREGSKTVKRTLANLSHLPEHAIEALRLCLKGVRLCDAPKTFAVKSTIPCGHVKAMRMAMARLGMAELVSSKPCSERDIVLAMIAQRLVEPCSKLETAVRFSDTTVAADFGLPPGTDEDALGGRGAGPIYAEDNLPSARAARDPVAKAGPTDEAKRKKRTGLSAGGFALRDWRGVMSALASQCRTTVEAGGIPVSMDTEPTAYQAEVFRLLSAKSPVWGGVPRNRNETWAGGNAPAPLK